MKEANARRNLQRAPGHEVVKMFPAQAIALNALHSTRTLPSKEGVGVFPAVSKSRKIFDLRFAQRAGTKIARRSHPFRERPQCGEGQGIRLMPIHQALDAQRQQVGKSNRAPGSSDERKAKGLPSDEWPNRCRVSIQARSILQIWFHRRLSGLLPARIPKHRSGPIQQQRSVHWGRRLQQRHRVSRFLFLS